MRQKSCTPCRRSKRRCDLGFPVCQRCVYRKIARIYPWTAASSFVDTARAAEQGGALDTEVAAAAQFISGSGFATGDASSNNNNNNHSQSAWLSASNLPWPVINTGDQLSIPSQDLRASIPKALCWKIWC